MKKVSYSLLWPWVESSFLPRSGPVAGLSSFLPRAAQPGPSPFARPSEFSLTQISNPTQHRVRVRNLTGLTLEQSL
jgi:hypothetical protein